MSKRGWWIAAFLGMTTLALGLEITAAVVDSEDMPTWTDLIVDTLNIEVFAVIYGGFVLWLGVHFFPRFLAKRKADKEIPSDQS